MRCTAPVRSGLHLLGHLAHVPLVDEALVEREAHADVPVFYVATARLRVPGPPVTIVATGVAVNGRMVGAPTAQAVVGRRDAAVASAVLELVARANGDIVVAVEDANFVKRLLQPHRRFRAPLVFGIVADLHAEARDRAGGVRIVGGLAMPSDLQRCLRRVVREDLRHLHRGVSHGWESGSLPVREMPKAVHKVVRSPTDEAAGRCSPSASLQSSKSTPPTTTAHDRPRPPQA